MHSVTIAIQQDAEEKLTVAKVRRGKIANALDVLKGLASQGLAGDRSMVVEPDVRKTTARVKNLLDQLDRRVYGLDRVIEICGEMLQDDDAGRESDRRKIIRLLSAMVGAGMCGREQAAMVLSFEANSAAGG